MITMMESTVSTVEKKILTALTNLAMTRRNNNDGDNDDDDDDVHTDNKTNLLCLFTPSWSRRMEATTRPHSRQSAGLAASWPLPL